MELKFYSSMTPDEQLQYVTDLSEFINEKLPVLERIGDAWEMSHRKDMETGLRLIGAFQFARDFVDKALRYGDYAARVSRLRVYFDKVKAEVGKGLSIKGSDGHTYALVAPSVPARRRGRPTKEEAEARLKGIEVEKPSDPEMEKQLKIAQLMGMAVQVSKEAPREKNNAEVAAEKAAKKAEYDKQNPSLFPDEGQAAAPAGSSGKGNGSAANGRESVPSDPTAPQNGLPCPTMSEVYQSRVDQDRLRLSDLAWLCSEELKQRIPQVQGLRVTAESASERAKTMTDMGATPDQIEPYARQAKDAVEGYMAIYQAVDEELAVLHKRLYLDTIYLENFKRRFKGVDIEKVLHITRPYYEKIKEQERADADRMKEKGLLTIDERIRLLIERDNPEHAAALKAEEEKKKEVQAINRYLKRTDKPASDERVQTMRQRIERLRELCGDEFADAYLPILNKTIEDNKLLHANDPKPEPEAPAEEKPKKAAKKATDKKTSTKKTSKKS